MATMMYNVFCNSAPTDRVYLDNKAVQEMFSFWKKPETVTIPSDIFKQKTVPLPDIEFIVEETQEKVRVIYNDPVKGKYVTFVGAILINIDGHQIQAELYCKDNNDDLFLEGITTDLDIKPNQYQNLANLIGHRLAVWYGIQITMLHPQVQKSYFRGGKDKQTVQVASKKRKTKYITKLYINERTLKEATADAKRVYKCLAWYVCGHYRHYKNGTVQFIQGYWKGVMRDTKQNQDEGRIREV